MRSFYEPTQEQLTKIAQPWCASFSGGKDSTSLVTWIEWLRRAGWLTVERPQLVRSDTGVEDAVLADITAEMEGLLRRSGWQCAEVRPRVKDKLFVMILGRGVTPIHPGIRSMRWCTRSTKIDPMKRWRTANANGLCLTGVRIGESDMRDNKIKKKSSCAAGGECGMPDIGDRTYSPILHWRTCHVIDWLSGFVRSEVRSAMADVFVVTKRLVEVYDVRVGQQGFDFYDPEITAARFGCIGCPAIQSERHAPPSVVARYGADSPLCELYDVWFEARRRANRCYRKRICNGVTTKGFGPIRLAVRNRLFARVMDIQRRAGVVLVTPDDEAYIRQCWADKVYPRGWSEADELTEPPTDTPLFV